LIASLLEDKRRNKSTFFFGNVNKDSIASNSDNSFMELSQRSHRVLTEIGFLAEMWNPGTRKTRHGIHHPE